MRVSEAGDADAMPNRVHVVASDGKFYAPQNAYARSGHVGDNVFHNAGEFTLTLPVGEASLSFVRGFEFEPQTRKINVVEGEVARLDIALERLDDMAAKGWYSASTHVHANYGGNLHNTLENLMLMSRAEDPRPRVRTGR